jgi:hypothetical protein
VLEAVLGRAIPPAAPGLQVLKASSVARLACKRLESAVPPAQLAPCYLRPADAKPYRGHGVDKSGCDC